MKICIECNSKALYRCKNCSLATYCSKECQKRDWITNHKKVCQLISDELSNNEMRCSDIRTLDDYQQLIGKTLKKRRFEKLEPSQDTLPSKNPTIFPKRTKKTQTQQAYENLPGQEKLNQQQKKAINEMLNYIKQNSLEEQRSTDELKASLNKGFQQVGMTQNQMNSIGFKINRLSEHCEKLFSEQSIESSPSGHTASVLQSIEDLTQEYEQELEEIFENQTHPDQTSSESLETKIPSQQSLSDVDQIIEWVAFLVKERYDTLATYEAESKKLNTTDKTRKQEQEEENLPYKQVEMLGEKILDSLHIDDELFTNSKQMPKYSRGREQPIGDKCKPKQQVKFSNEALEEASEAYLGRQPYPEMYYQTKEVAKSLIDNHADEESRSFLQKMMDKMFMVLEAINVNFMKRCLVFILGSLALCVLGVGIVWMQDWMNFSLLSNLKDVFNVTSFLNQETQANNFTVYDNDMFGGVNAIHRMFVKSENIEKSLINACQSLKDQKGSLIRPLLKTWDPVTQKNIEILQANNLSFCNVFQSKNIDLVLYDTFRKLPQNVKVQQMFYKNLGYYDNEKIKKLVQKLIRSSNRINGVLGPPMVNSFLSELSGIQKSLFPINNVYLRDVALERVKSLHGVIKSMSKPGQLAVIDLPFTSHIKKDLSTMNFFGIGEKMFSIGVQGVNMIMSLTCISDFSCLEKIVQGSYSNLFALWEKFKDSLGAFILKNWLIQTVINMFLSKWILYFVKVTEKITSGLKWLLDTVENVFKKSESKPELNVASVVEASVLRTEYQHSCSFLPISFSKLIKKIMDGSSTVLKIGFRLLCMAPLLKNLFMIVGGVSTFLSSISLSLPIVGFGVGVGIFALLFRKSILNVSYGAFRMISEIGFTSNSVMLATLIASFFYPTIGSLLGDLEMKNRIKDVFSSVSKDHEQVLKIAPYSHKDEPVLETIFRMFEQSKDFSNATNQYVYDFFSSLYDLSNK